MQETRYGGRKALMGFGEGKRALERTIPDMFCLFVFCNTIQIISIFRLASHFPPMTYLHLGLPMDGMVASRDTELQPSRFGLTQDMRVVQKVVCEPNSMVQVVMRSRKQVHEVRESGKKGG